MRDDALRLEENVSLASLTTLGIGGPARWLATASTEADVTQACCIARERGLPLFTMGGGSNLLVSDEGFAGLVLRVAITGVQIFEAIEKRVEVRSGAGVNWDELVQVTVEKNLQGIECLAGIPGNVGGTPVQNVGAYGQDVSQTIVRVRCFDLLHSTFVELSNRECGFAYRTSRLNTVGRGRYVITGVDFSLTSAGAPNLSYADLRHRFPAGEPSLAETAEAVRTIRRGKGMVVDAADPDSRSAGSFFRNPVVSSAMIPAIASTVRVRAAEVPTWPAGPGCVKLPAAWLLEHAGFSRGYTIGAAGISSKHTLALVNRGGATARDVIELREKIVTEVRRRFEIDLEQEPVNVGF